MLNDRTQNAFEPKKVRSAMKKAFGGPMGKLALAWIADTCGATRMMIAEGRRQVWLAIQDVLSMSESDIRDLQSEVASYGGNDE